MAHPVRRRIMVVDWDEGRGEQIVGLMEAEGHFSYLVGDADRAMSQIYNDPPDLIILSAKGDCWREFLGALKTDNVFRYLPVLALFERDDLKPAARFEDLPIDDLVLLPLDERELVLHVRLALVRSSRQLDANPLTRLPGNYTILHAVQDLIDGRTPFALAYIDLDNFKPFNDHYGFSRGDEILRMTARILANAVRQLHDPVGFVGHVGGDDFVITVTPEHIDGICKQIISHFDMLATTFYDDEDRLHGYIESVDRQGHKRRFPLLTVSIAAVISTSHEFTHYGEFSTACSEVKTVVKRLDGSNYMIDRRGATESGGVPREPPPAN